MSKKRIKFNTNPYVAFFSDEENEKPASVERSESVENVQSVGSALEKISVNKPSEDRHQNDSPIEKKEGVESSAGSSVSRGTSTSIRYGRAGVKALASPKNSKVIDKTYKIREDQRGKIWAIAHVRRREMKDVLIEILDRYFEREDCQKELKSLKNSDPERYQEWIGQFE